jgi:hypothetical protein
MRRFDVSQSVCRAYGPACEEDECGMEMDAGLDNTGHDTEGWDAAGRDAGGFSNTGSRAGSTPDARKLAQDWITLWQSEISAMAADPEIREAWQTVMALWAGTMSTMLRGLPRGQDATRNDSARRRSGTADAPRSAPPAAAPDTRDAEIERLARHVAALERRLAELERVGDPASRPGVDPKPRPGRKPRR